jgi:ActD protein
MARRDPIYGLMAEFDSAQALVDAAKKTHEAGYKKIDAYSPFPIEGLAEEIGMHFDEVPLTVLIGGIIGGCTGYLMQYWMAAVDYPLNIGGKPPHSWPAFIVITFEMTILFAGISAVLGMLAFNGLPMPYHPVFNVPRFALASKDRFFLIVFSSDKKYNPTDTRTFLEGLAPRSISEVPS